MGYLGTELILTIPKIFSRIDLGSPIQSISARSQCRVSRLKYARCRANRTYISRCFNLSRPLYFFQSSRHSFNFFLTIKNLHNDDKYTCSLLCSQPKDTAKRQYLTFLIAQANLYKYHRVHGDVWKSWVLFRHPREFKIKFLHNNYLILNIALKSKEAAQKLKFLDSPVPNSDKTVQGKTVSL